jgi:nitrous oxidase accessory protein NosD
MYRLFAVVAAWCVVTPTWADTISVSPGASIQAAINGALDGDTVEVAAGEFNENINFLGKAITVVGVGPATVIRGADAGPVVTFANGESGDSILDSVTVTGGQAQRGGGIFISAASPTILRVVITQNRASQQGSGVYIESSSTARLYNNLLIYNVASGGDPHSLQIVNASPLIVNNTIARGDSNGLLISGVSFPLIMNNIIALNGSAVGGVRGRGICDFSGDRALIAYNDFFNNKIAALLRGGRDWRLVQKLQRVENDPQVINNIDGPPAFRGRPPRDPDLADESNFFLSSRGRKRATDSGNPDPACNDLDGTRNDMGFTGGPFAAGSLLTPTGDVCGAP